MLKVGTLFSGIGAFEQALKQLGIPHKIEFACDNGEIELIPLQKLQERWEYKRLDRRAKNLDEAEMARYLELKAQVSKEIERIRTEALKIEDKRQLHEYVTAVYKKYGADKENKMRKAYLANYTINEDDFYTDVRFMNGTIYANQIDIMVGGSPCQSFSTYGKKRGLEDTRGTLFYDYARIIQEVQPRIFIYENVPGLLTHDEGKTWITMKEVWSSLGYVIDESIKVLNAADYNHPQNRKRLFLIGFKKDIYTQPYVFPPKRELTHKASEYLQKRVDDKYYLGKKGFEWVTSTKKNLNKTRYNRDVIGCQTANQQFNWTGDLLVERPAKRHYNNPNIYIGELNGKPAVARKMTPRECLNLMGFDSDFAIVVEDKEAYRQSGNSIVVPVLKEIIESLKPYLGTLVEN